MTDQIGGVGFRSDRGPVLMSLMLSSSLVALDSTIIATAVPSVVASLGGFSQFPWLFSVYLLAQAVSVPIYGRLADVVGRKPIILIGIGTFLVGSLLCGFAWNMTSLIVFRAVQGLGAGAIQPMCLTIVADLYTLRERAKVQGYLASVWAISAVVGPTVGGLFSQYLSWRWLFFINLPMCVLAAWMLTRRFQEKLEPVRHRIDYLGAVLLTVGCTLVILGLLEGGHAWTWDSAMSIGVLVGGAVLLVAFVWVQRHAPEPILPLWVLRRRVLAVTSGIAVAVGALVMGLTSYVPTYAQGGLQVTPLAAGFALATLTLGWPIAASLSGRLYLRIGFRWTALIGGTISVIGTLAMSTLLGAVSSIYLVAALCFVIGMGMGLVASPSLIAAQSSVGWAERGVVTGANMFARSLGSAVGVAVFGALANAVLSSTPTSAELTVAAHRVFVAIAVITVAMTALIAMLPAHVRTGPSEAA